MARIVDYSIVLETLVGAGFECLYHNSGAFGFPRAVSTQSVGWVGPPDASLRPAALALTRQVAPPSATNMAALATRAWRDVLPGPLWLMPRSHWAYELDFGNAGWLPKVLNRVGIDATLLAGRNDGSAIEFDAGESGAFQGLLQDFLAHLRGSDFALAFPCYPVTCTVHHHTQLWWTTSDASVFAAIDALLP